jgi:hypothetical protein
MSLSVVDVLRVAPPFELAFVEPVVVLDPRFGFEFSFPPNLAHYTLGEQAAFTFGRNHTHYSFKDEDEWQAN